MDITGIMFLSVQLDVYGAVRLIGLVSLFLFMLCYVFLSECCWLIFVNYEAQRNQKFIGEKKPTTTKQKSANEKILSRSFTKREDGQTRKPTLQNTEQLKTTVWWPDEVAGLPQGACR